MDFPQYLRRACLLRSIANAAIQGIVSENIRDEAELAHCAIHWRRTWLSCVRC